MFSHDLNIGRIQVWLTTKCNFECDYCHNRYFLPECDYSKLEPKVAIDACKEAMTTIGQDTFHIVYTGGEPLLRFNEMKEITEELYNFSKQINKSLIFSIITNGTLVTDEVEEHFRKYGYRISISCDGTFEAFCHRGITKQLDEYEKVISAINRLNDTQFFNISMVITNQNVNHLFDSFKFLASLGIRHFAIAPEVSQLRFLPDKDQYKDQLISIIDFIKASREQFKVNPPLEQSWALNNFGRRVFSGKGRFNIRIRENVSLISTFERPRFTPIGITDDMINEILKVENEASNYYKRS